MGDDNNDDPFSYSIPGYDNLGFLILTKCLGFISMAASSLIARDVIQKLPSAAPSTTMSFGGIAISISSWPKRVSLTQSVIFCMALGDLGSNFFVQFLSTWMVPSTVNVSGSSGTVGTCVAQGILGYFFYTLSAASNASLAVSYCLIVKFGWRDNDQDRHRVSFTLAPIICATILAIVPIPGKHYNYNGSFFCDISAAPLGCDYEETSYTCSRGAEARYILLYLAVIPFMVFFAIIIVSVMLLIYSVLKQERRMDRYQREGQPLQRSMTNQTARQGMYYIAAFGLTWIPWYIYAILEYKHGYIPESLGAIHVITMPLQGVLNAMVYFRPKYKSRRGRNPNEPRISSILRVLKISMPSVKCCSTSMPHEPSVENRKGELENGLGNQKEEDELGNGGNIRDDIVASTGEKPKTSVVQFADTAKPSTDYGTELPSTNSHNSH